MIVDLVLPSGKIIKQHYTYKGPRALNDYSANTSNSNTPDRWWDREPKTAYNMMSAAPNMLHVNAEKW